MCKESKECKVKFLLNMKKQPEENDKTFYEVRVEKTGEHEHTDTTKQLRGNLCWTIKAASPFTEEFEKVQIESTEDLSESGEENLLLNHDLIDLMQKFYMPYIFIWVGFVFRKMNPKYSITRIDQGCIEKYFGTCKRAKRHEAIVPAKYVLDSFQTVLANSIMLTKPKTKKRKQGKNDGNFKIIFLVIYYSFLI